MAAERVKSMYSTASDTPITLDPALLAKGAALLAEGDGSALPALAEGEQPAASSEPEPSATAGV